MINVKLTEKELIYTLLALDSYANALLQDQDDPGPSRDDADFVTWVLSRLRREYLDQDGRVRADLITKNEAE